MHISPGILTIFYILIVNIVTFLVRGWDKYQAIKGGWRVSEKQLIQLCRAGGWIGALAGMEIRRHKTIKGSFQKKFWSAAGTWILALAALGYEGQP